MLSKIVEVFSYIILFILGAIAGLIFFPFFIINHPLTEEIVYIVKYKLMGEERGEDKDENDSF